MKIMYLDLETTGLNYLEHQIIEIGCLLDDTTRPDVPMDMLPTLRLLIGRENYSGHPVALAMHQKLFAEIGLLQKDRVNSYDLVSEENVAGRLATFLKANGIEKYITAGGKNVAGFDLRFLAQLPNFRQEGSRLVMYNHDIQIAQRVIDPAILYWNPRTDTQLPDTNECLKRAGIEKQTDHTAIGDCKLICELVRRKS